jgi:hypothetical protein
MKSAHRKEAIGSKAKWPTSESMAMSNDQISAGRVTGQINMCLIQIVAVCRVIFELAYVGFFSPLFIFTFSAEGNTSLPVPDDLHSIFILQKKLLAQLANMATHHCPFLAP